jgi:hypothetical protein
MGFKVHASMEDSLDPDRVVDLSIEDDVRSDDESEKVGKVFAAASP